MSKSEKVDLVDSFGKVRLKSIPRDEVDLYPEMHLQIVIVVVVNSQGQILVHQRARTKKVNPGCIDHVCGGVMSGEDPYTAAKRESAEETGIVPVSLKIVEQGLNKYNRYRYLLYAESDHLPGSPDKSEVEWVKFFDLSYLQQKASTGEWEFVDEFFEESELAIAGR